MTLLKKLAVNFGLLRIQNILVASLRFSQILVVFVCVLFISPVSSPSSVSSSSLPYLIISYHYDRLSLHLSIITRLRSRRACDKLCRHLQDFLIGQKVCDGGAFTFLKLEIIDIS